jgi:dCMP deaminase
MEKRPPKDEYYLEIAKAVAQRSPCIRRKYGAVIVKNDAIVSTGYNGPARGVINCFEVGCIKDLQNLPHGMAYEDCPGVHAEENAVVNAARNGSNVLGGILI